MGSAVEAFCSDIGVVVTVTGPVIVSTTANANIACSGAGGDVLMAPVRASSELHNPVGV